MHTNPLARMKELEADRDSYVIGAPNGIETPDPEGWAREYPSDAEELDDLYHVIDSAEALWQREGGYCASSLVHTLARYDGRSLDLSCDDHLAQLTEQAFELSTPIDDWESTAREAGWAWDEPGREFRLNDTPEGIGFDAAYSVGGIGPHDWQSLCRAYEIEPYQREVYEHWIVSGWLANELAKRGEKVDKDFAGLAVWARTRKTEEYPPEGDPVIVALMAEG